MRKRDFLAAGLGLGAGLAASAALAPVRAQAPAAAPAGGGRGRNIPNRKARTTRLFKAPGAYPNALAIAPEGLWIGQQKNAALQQSSGNMSEAAWLVDWNGRLLKTLQTNSRNTSGMAYGDNCVWMGANAAPNGVFQVDMNSNEVSHRQIPMSLNDQGGGCHGLQWHDGKLWIAALRLGGALRVDPKNWAPEVLIPVQSPEKPRLHDITFDDNGDMWIVTGTNSTGPQDAHAGLSKYDGKTGQLAMTVDFEPGSCDPHGLVWHDGKLVSSDAGIHPGWPDNASPTNGWIFAIDLV
jgi:hypothetical protein